MTGPVSVTVYSDKNFKGIRAAGSISGSSCVMVPSVIENVKSLKIVGNKSSCIEHHYDDDCCGPHYAIVRPGYPMLNDLTYHSMGNASKLAISAKAISLCGKFCHSAWKPGKDALVLDVGVGPIPSKIYQGVRKDFDISISSNHYNPPRTASFNVTECTNLPPYLFGKLSRIISNSEKCINMYAEENCQGRVTRWQPYRNFLPDPFHHWDGNILTNFQLNSMSPCNDKCDPQYWQGSENLTEINLTLYNDEGFNGSTIALTVKLGDCLILPRNFTPKSIEFKGNESCIELHKAEHCGDIHYFPLRPGYPNLNSLWFYGMDDESSVGAPYASAVSLCGSFCEKKMLMKEVNHPPKEKLEEGVVTMFGYTGLYGNPTNYNLNQGCVNIDADKVGYPTSLWTYGQCVVLFGTKNCKKESIFTETLQTSDKPIEYYMEKLTTFTFALGPRSMRLCNETELSLALEQVTETFPHFNSVTECASNTSGVLFYILIGFGCFIYTMFLVTLGAFINAKYHAFSLKEDTKLFTVLYKAKKEEGSDRLL